MSRSQVIKGGTSVALASTVTLIPVLYVIYSSFDVSSIGAPFEFGLAGWRDAVVNSRTIQSVAYSLLLSIRVPIALSVAFLIAWFLIRFDPPGRRFIELSLWFGFVLPSVPMVLGWILLLDPHYGLLNAAAKYIPGVETSIFNIYSVAGIIWVHLALTTVPIMVIFLGPALRQLDSAFEEAADMSGANTLHTLKVITIPLLVPAILTALLAGFIRSLETFEIEQILGVPAGIFVYSTRIFDLLNSDPPKFAQAMSLSTVFVFLLVALAMVYQAYLEKAGSRPTIAARGVRLQSRIKPLWVPVVSWLIIAYIGVSIFLPLAILILGSFSKLFGFFFIQDPWSVQHWATVFRDERFLRATSTSLVLGLFVGLAGVLLFSLIAWCLVRAKFWGRSIMSVLIWLPLGIPGLVLGVTFLSLMLNVPGLSKVYGTLTPLILALIINAMPIGVHLLRGAIAQLSNDLEEAGSMSGAEFSFIFRKVTLPLIAPAIASVFLLTFAGTIRDISTILLIAAPGTRTMSLLMFDFATQGRLESAAVIGVMIALICLVMTSIANRLGNRFGIGA